MHGRLLAIVVFFLAGCFQPADSAVPIRCDADNSCPTDQVCLAGLCSAVPPADMTTSEDMAIASVGCASGGMKLGDRMWACPGAFSMGQARSLCSIGWSVCKNLSDLDMSVCNSQTAVFIADVPAYQPGAGPPTCATTTIYQRLFGACATNGSVLFATACAGFFRFAVDQYAGFDFQNGHSIDKAIGKTATNGVLCCR